MQATIITLEAQIAARCKACSVLTPVPGLRNEVTCRGCAAPIDFAARAADSREGGLRYTFRGYYDAVAEAALLLKDGQDCRDARDSQGTPVKLRRARPACLACGAFVSPPAPGAAFVACGCGDSVAVRWPDDETRRWDPRITCVIGDGKGRGAPARDQVQGAVVPCGHCGAPLAIQDRRTRQRSRRCDHCGASNYVPDAAWLALFPQPDWHRFYLVYALDARGVLALHDWMAGQQGKYWLSAEQKAHLEALRAQARAAARADVVAALMRGDAKRGEIEALATDPALTDAEAAAVDACLDDRERERIGARASSRLVVRWAASPAVALRRLAASHASVGAAMLDALAGDVDAAVRAAVAARPDAPTGALTRLRKDTDATVVAAVRQNPSYKPGLFERIFG